MPDGAGDAPTSAYHEVFSWLNVMTPSAAETVFWLLNWSQVGVVDPQGYVALTSLCASAVTATVAALPFTGTRVRPNSTAGRPSGANSVRVGCRPSVTGKVIRTKPGPLV